MRVPLGEIYHFLSTSGRGQKQQNESMRKGYKISRSKIHVHERPGDWSSIHFCRNFKNKEQKVDTNRTGWRT